MAIEQAYFFSVALINLVFAFAATRVKELENRSNSIRFFMIAFFAYFVSWFIYVFEVGTMLEITSAFTSTIFVWAMVIFACKRTATKVPWLLIIGLFSLNCAAQLYFILQSDLTYYLHISGVFLPVAFGSISYMFLRLKTVRYPSDSVVGYAFLFMAFVIMSRSILMEVSPELFSQSSIYSQIIWPAFCAVIGVFALLSYTEEIQSKLEKESNTDQLTGIYNRRMFDSKLKHVLGKLIQHNHVGALIYLDLDGFKPINDRFGHYVGDTVLVELGSRLQHRCQFNEVVARLGGDEFAILIVNAGSSLDEAESHAQKVAQQIQQLVKNPINTHGLVLQVDCSVGIHMLSPNSQSAHIALREADNAMYRSKKSQRGSITFSSETPKANYSIAKIGIDEIDEDHQLLDDLIQTVHNNHRDFTDFRSLFKQQMKQHFQNEVKVSKRLGLNMTSEHIQQHAQIIKSLNELSSLADEDSVHEYLAIVHKILETHALEFDRALVPSPEHR